MQNGFQRSYQQEESSNDEIGMLSVYDKPVDYTIRENVNSIIDYVNCS
jgi:hypothetical protein